MRIEANDNNSSSGTEQLAYRGTISKFPIICGLIITVFLMMIFSTLHDIKSTNAAIAKQKQDIANFETAEKEYEQTVEKQTNIQIEESQDPAVARRNTDDGLANQMFGILLNWRTIDEYNTARTAMMTMYGLTEDSPLLKDMLPPVDEKSYGQENMRFNLAKTYELENDGSGMIQYFALCRVSTNISGDMSRGIVGVFYNISADGTFSDITAYPISNY